LRIGYGPITVQRHPESSAPWSQLYADNLAMVEHAEQLGFQSAWVSEHHFAPDGYLSAGFVMLGAMAARTSTLILGSRVLVAPLHHPIRLAEDAAAVAALSDGRLILGLSAGYRPVEFQTLTGSMDRRAHRLSEAVRTCRTAWLGQPFRHPADDDQGEAIVLVPPASIPIWLGGRATAAIRRAALTADGFVAPAGDPIELARLLARLDEAAGPRAQGPLPVCVSAYVSMEGRSNPATESGIARMLAGYAEMTARDNPTARVGQSSAASDMVARGTPRQIAERLAEFVRAAGPDRLVDLVVRLEYPGMSRDDVFRHLDQFVSGVVPILRELVG
jgi:alkanesulfonate monooxygenase SsuD/methylene tetrahydromethanopterin reductase-like flavin-dependent oxidoreductase (luciferase family)